MMNANYRVEQPFLGLDERKSSIPPNVGVKYFYVEITFFARSIKTVFILYLTIIKDPPYMNLQVKWVLLSSI